MIISVVILPNEQDTNRLPEQVSDFFGMVFDSIERPQEQIRFAIELLEKDLRYAQKMASQLGIENTLLDDTHAEFDKAKSSGLGGRARTVIFDNFHWSV